jgi:hypothetical protein
MTGKHRKFKNLLTYSNAPQHFTINNPMAGRKQTEINTSMVNNN